MALTGSRLDTTQGEKARRLGWTAVVCVYAARMLCWAAGACLCCQDVVLGCRSLSMLPGCCTGLQWAAIFYAMLHEFMGVDQCVAA
jgi:hypothetical protein